MHELDTIAAISTPLGTGGIGIVRISGPEAFGIAEAVFRGTRAFSDIPSHTVSYGKIIDADSGETIDEVLALKLEQPRTFTREDMVELDCHGGTVVLRRVLEQVIKAGARPAEPGEFTKRAFLNGRIDLSQAEAVIDLINAKTLEGSKAAVGQLEGRLSRSLNRARRRLVELMAHMEVTFDYPEHDTEEITAAMVLEGIAEVRGQLLDISGSFERGRIIREGINIVITGKPNVGKSTLLNELAGSGRAIVTDIPGTTRDIIEEYISIRGIPVRLTDTAGLRETEDAVERIGVEKAELAVENADLVIAVLDAGTGISDLDRDVLLKVKGRLSVYMVNKTDLASTEQLAAIKKELGGTALIEARLKDGEGVRELEEHIYGLFMGGRVKANDEVLLTSTRHKKLVDAALADLGRAGEALKAGMPLDLAAIDIRSAAESLGMITGEAVDEEVLTEIFSKFCVGK